MHCNQIVNSQRAILVALASVIIASLILCACREKDSPIIGPEPPPTGDWSIQLENTAFLFVPNDTIDVRLFNPFNEIAVGMPLRFRCVADSGMITANATTTSFLPGCNPPLIYWGDGSDDEENPSETVHAYYIVGGDTLAHAFRSYGIQLRP